MMVNRQQNAAHLLASRAENNRRFAAIRTDFNAEALWRHLSRRRIKRRALKRVEKTFYAVQLNR